jgi:hypothetical protein
MCINSHKGVPETRTYTAHGLKADVHSRTENYNRIICLVYLLTFKSRTYLLKYTYTKVQVVLTKLVSNIKNMLRDLKRKGNILSF